MSEETQEQKLPEGISLQQIFTELNEALRAINGKMIDENVTAAQDLFEREGINQGDFVIDLLAANMAIVLRDFFPNNLDAAFINFYEKLNGYDSQIRGNQTESGIITPNKTIITQ